MVTQRYVIRLRVVAADLPVAQRLARLVGRWLLVLPQTGGLAEQFVYNIRSPNRPLEELPNDEPQ
ncbi:hypothetical protein Nm8I071_36430 [Nonomuraea sp. TT08I-71]|nr:hypothetical protein Nm8I071_36430 [Nonomuraea sp. TT08I-71]